MQWITLARSVCRWAWRCRSRRWCRNRRMGWNRDRASWTQRLASRSPGLMSALARIAEAFDLVEPGGICRREMNVPARTTCEASSDLGMRVGGVVVDDELGIELGWHVGLCVAQEGAEIL